MTRRLLNLLTLLSLLLFVAVAALWVRSYRYDDNLGWDWSSSRHGQLESREGGLTLHDAVTTSPGELFTGFLSRYIEPPDRNPRLVGDGFASFRAYNLPPDRFWTVPHWSAALLTACGPALRLRKALAATRRGGKGLCRACGYDLTANVSGVCPECGTATCASKPAGDAAGPAR